MHERNPNQRASVFQQAHKDWQTVQAQGANYEAACGARDKDVFFRLTQNRFSSKVLHIGTNQAGQSGRKEG